MKRSHALGALTVGVALLVAAAGCRTTTRQDSALREELVRLGREDQAQREGFGAAAASNDTAFGRRLMQGDSARTARLREIVRRHGWPTRALAGEDGSHAAWLILQHSDDVGFQQAMLPRLWQAAERDEVKKAEVAMLEDKTLRRSGRLQRYGSSFSMKDGRLVPDPIDDPANLDARRASVGLPPMAEYARMLGEVYKVPVDWPPRP